MSECQPLVQPIEFRVDGVHGGPLIQRHGCGSGSGSSGRGGVGGVASSDGYGDKMCNFNEDM
jgi:hypothetical protein